MVINTYPNLPLMNGYAALVQALVDIVQAPPPFHPLATWLQVLEYCYIDAGVETDESKWMHLYHMLVQNLPEPKVIELAVALHEDDDMLFNYNHLKQCALAIWN